MTEGSSQAMDGTNPLGGFRWRNRIVVIVADDDDRNTDRRQRDRLRASGEGLRERDVVIVVATGETVDVDGVESANIPAGRLRAALGVTDRSFQVLLIGKDGGVKYRSDDIVVPETIFALIDAMPMRQSEMARQSAGDRTP